jgi:hypothetical protein
MTDRELPHLRLAAVTLRRIAALVLTRAHRHGLRPITTPGLVTAVPDKHANSRSVI